ncbi:hypothetical protein BRADI_3g23841v3 [Brachypodium distachyon]|uniref:Uncharacterized protein n=1 Tax=Brachypodium distachyon TaxID=15368 RepID=A0A2K2CZ49_BRADI|nr:hypothetical protein BRADI_3g23841v3 [Brachypodium distachyon]
MFKPEWKGVMPSASKHILFAIGVSKHNISYVFSNSSAKSEPCLLLHVDLSVKISGTWNLGCDVLTPCRSRAAIPHDTTATTILPSERILLSLFPQIIIDCFYY